MQSTDRIETDYLVIGAGLAGVAFADAMVGTDTTVTLVDRRHAPGGQWLSAYPFVRLHQPSRLYGVTSVPLSHDRIVTHGVDAGLYERASGPELCGYFDRVMRQRLLPSGQVRFLSRTDYLGDGRLRSLATGRVSEVTCPAEGGRCALHRGADPATTSAPFEVADGVRVVTPGELAYTDAPREGFVVIGAGKTAMDTCQYLLETGVDPERIRWVRARDLWLMNREYLQGGEFVLRARQSVTIQLEAAAKARDVDDYFERCADAGLFLPIDPATRPTQIRGATSHERELEALRQIESVIRLGYVRRIERDRIVLDQGTVPTSDGWVHVHCAASAVPVKAPRPIFERDRITMQYVRMASPSFSFGLIGFLEASRRANREKNQIAEPNPFPADRQGWIRGTVQSFGQGAYWRLHGDVAAWLDNRLDLMQGMAAREEHARGPLGARALQGRAGPRHRGAGPARRAGCQESGRVIPSPDAMCTKAPADLTVARRRWEQAPAARRAARTRAGRHDVSRRRAAGASPRRCARARADRAHGPRRLGRPAADDASRALGQRCGGALQQRAMHHRGDSLGYVRTRLGERGTTPLDKRRSDSTRSPASKSGRREIASQSVTPHENTSLRGLGSAPRASSGAE